MRILFTLLFCFQLLAVSANNFQTDFQSIFNDVANDFTSIKDLKAKENSDYKDVYAAPYTVPKSKSAEVIVSNFSNQRYLKAILDINLNTEDGKAALDGYMQNFAKLDSFEISQFNNNSDDKAYTIAKGGRFIGGMSVNVQNGKPILRVFAFDASALFADIKKLINAAESNEFADYIGTEEPGLEKNQKTSTFKTYKSSFSTYNDVQELKLVAHQNHYSSIPSGLLIQLIGLDNGRIAQLLGSEYAIERYEYLEKKEELIVILNHNDRPIYLQVMLRGNTQILSVAI